MCTTPPSLQTPLSIPEAISFHEPKALCPGPREPNFGPQTPSPDPAQRSHLPPAQGSARLPHGLPAGPAALAGEIHPKFGGPNTRTSPWCGEAPPPLLLAPLQAQATQRGELFPSAEAQIGMPGGEGTAPLCLISVPGGVLAPLGTPAARHGLSVPWHGARRGRELAGE